VGWLLLVALVVLWAAFLVPSWASSPNKADKSMKDFERNMDMLAETESQGRWIVTPRKGTTFIGLRARAQARARERRRRQPLVANFAHTSPQHQRQQRGELSVQEELGDATGDSHLYEMRDR